MGSRNLQPNTGTNLSYSLALWSERVRYTLLAHALGAPEKSGVLDTITYLVYYIPPILLSVDSPFIIALAKRWTTKAIFTSSIFDDPGYHREQVCAITVGTSKMDRTRGLRTGLEADQVRSISRTTESRIFTSYWMNKHRPIVRSSPDSWWWLTA